MEFRFVEFRFKADVPKTSAAVITLEPFNPSEVESDIEHNKIEAGALGEWMGNKFTVQTVETLLEALRVAIRPLHQV